MINLARVDDVLDEVREARRRRNDASRRGTYANPLIRDEPGELDDDVVRLTRDWVWPQAIEDRPPWRPPVISDRYRFRDGRGRWHNGVDLGYRRDVALDEREQNENQSRYYDIWPGTAIVAAGPGRVTYAGQTRVRGLVAIRHRGNLQTRYVHLERIDVAKGEQVEAGHVLGTAGVFGGLRHLHFELWKGYRRRVLDPGAYMPRWDFVRTRSPLA